MKSKTTITITDDEGRVLSGASVENEISTDGVNGEFNLRADYPAAYITFDQKKGWHYEVPPIPDLHIAFAVDSD